jgi:flavin reductase (DIM6/NTAB) family NADH-FMN oxidoreductase RutF
MIMGGTHNMDERTFRDAMGTFPTGVAVVTTLIDDKVHGMTANALMSVSLKPKLLMISIDEKASMLDKINDSQQFALSILGDNQLDISMHFAGQKRHDSQIQFDWLNGMPVISGALTQIACVVEDAYLAGDHTLFLGRVEHIRLKDSGSPLTFYKGKYLSLSE